MCILYSVWCVAVDGEARQQQQRRQQHSKTTMKWNKRVFGKNALPEIWQQRLKVCVSRRQRNITIFSFSFVRSFVWQGEEWRVRDCTEQHGTHRMKQNKMKKKEKKTLTHDSATHTAQCDVVGRSVGRACISLARARSLSPSAHSAPKMTFYSSENRRQWQQQCACRCGGNKKRSLIKWRRRRRRAAKKTYRRFISS